MSKEPILYCKGCGYKLVIVKSECYCVHCMNSVEMRAGVQKEAYGPDKRGLGDE